MKRFFPATGIFIPLFSLLLILLSFRGAAQAVDSTYFFKGYMLHTESDDHNVSAILSLFKSNRLVSSKTFPLVIYDLQFVDFNNDNNPKIVARLYSGGAHCCFTVAVLDIINDTLALLASKDIANSDFVIKDISHDGKKEIVFFDDRFAYEFTSFADSRFFVEIDKLDNGHLVAQNKLFRDYVLKDIERHKADLEKIMRTGEITKSDLPLAQALLAAITGDYYSLGEDRKGFDLVNRLYTGPDKDQFIAYLRLKLSSAVPTSYTDFLKLNK